MNSRKQLTAKHIQRLTDRWKTDLSTIQRADNFLKLESQADPALRHVAAALEEELVRAKYEGPVWVAYADRYASKQYPKAVAPVAAFDPYGRVLIEGVFTSDAQADKPLKIFSSQFQDARQAVEQAALEDDATLTPETVRAQALERLPLPSLPQLAAENRASFWDPTTRRSAIDWMRLEGRPTPVLRPAIQGSTQATQVTVHAALLAMSRDQLPEGAKWTVFKPGEEEWAQPGKLSGRLTDVALPPGLSNELQRNAEKVAWIAMVQDPQSGRLDSTGAAPSFIALDGHGTALASAYHKQGELHRDPKPLETWAKPHPKHDPNPTPTPSPVAIWFARGSTTTIDQETSGDRLLVAARKTVNSRLRVGLRDRSLDGGRSAAEPADPFRPQNFREELRDPFYEPNSSTTVIGAGAPKRLRVPDSSDPFAFYWDEKASAIAFFPGEAPGTFIAQSTDNRSGFQLAHPGDVNALRDEVEVGSKDPAGAVRTTPLPPAPRATTMVTPASGTETASEAQSPSPGSRTGCGPIGAAMGVAGKLARATQSLVGKLRGPRKDPGQPEGK